MTAPFQVGDVVCCVNAELCPVFGGNGGLIKHAIYRITAAKSGTCRRTGRAGNGVKTDRHNLPEGRWHNADMRFRKIEAPNTEIAQAIRACRPTPAKVDAA